MFGAKTPFGASSTFGTGTTAFGTQATASPFGQTAASGTGSIFGNTNTQSGFGTFGQTQQTGTGLFGSTAGNTGGGTGLFGSTSNTGSLFGQPVSSSGSIFGSNAVTSGNVFGQSGSFNTGTSGFGNTGKLFGTPATTQSTGLFGGGTQSSLFSGTTGFQSTGFGATQGAAQAGTPVKFNVVSGTDQMAKNGINTTVNTRHQCITVMKDYEAKSFEELRFEDYTLGRKSGPTASGGIFTGSTATTTAASTGGLFGSNTSSFSAFGQPKTGFGTTTGTSIFGQNNSSNTGGLFASKPGGLFGTNTATTSTSAFGSAFGSTPASGGLFGQASSSGQTAGLFGGTTTTQSGGLFSSTGFGQQSTGTTGLFGQSAFGQTQQQTGLFNNKLGTGTGFGSSTTGGLFGAQSKPTSTMFGGLGTGTGTAFGTGTNNQSLFGKTNTFGATNTLGTGFGTGTTATGLFGGGTSGLTAGNSLGTGLVAQTGFGSTFGQTAGTTLNLGGTNNLLGSQNNALAQQQKQLLLHQQILALNNSPFGDSKLFRNSLTDKTKADKANSSTTASSQKGLGSPSHYKVSSKLTAKIKPRPINYHTMNKSKLFEGLDDDVGLSPDTFVPRKSIKKLVIKKKDVDQNSCLQVLPQESSPSASLIDSDKDTSTPIGVRFSTGTRRLNNTINDLVPNGTNSQNSPTQTDKSEKIDKEDSVDDSIRLEPCGIMLKRPEYYTKPPIHELNEMVDSNGEVWVNDFTVGREGYGEVKFLGRTNVADLNLDEIVFFRRREIEVYPESYPNKPPVGEELNKKAEITLEKVWPNDKNTHKPIKTPERLRLQGWLEKVEAATSKLDATFIDYRPETGIWVFVVEHFTKYGIHEFLDDELALKKHKKEQFELDTPTSKELHKDPLIDDEKVIMIKKLKEQQAKIEALEQKKQDTVEESMQDQDSDIEDLDQETFPYKLAAEEEDFEDTVTNHQFATVQGVSAHRMQVMKASFFGESELIVPSPKPVTQSRITDSVEQKSYKFSTSLDSMLSPKVIKIADNHETMSGLKSSRKDIFPQTFLLPQAVASESPSSRIMAPSAVGSALDRGTKLGSGARAHQRELVPKKESLSQGKENLIADMGLVMGRSFRVGWGPGFTLVHSGSVPDQKNPKSSGVVLSSFTGDVLIPKSRLLSEADEGGPPFGVVIQRVDIAQHLNHSNENALKQHVSALEVELQYSKITNDGCPFFEPSPGTKSLHHHARTCKKNLESFVPGPFHDTAKHMSQMWDLMVALWGQSDEEDRDDQDMISLDRNSYESHLSRKQALSKWLSDVGKEKVKAEVDHAEFEESDYLGAIWSYVTGGQISKACVIAQQHKDHRLALLLAQASGNSSVRQLLQEQLRDWEVMKADNFMSDQRLKILALIAGSLVWRTSSKTLNACEGLDWKRVFAAHMWYHSTPTASIKDILFSYDSSYLGDSSYGQYGAPPLPPYQEDKTDKDATIAVQDICYHLIKLYCDRSHQLEQTLAPKTYTAHQLDYRQSWHLSLALQSLGYTHLSAYHTGVLCCSFAAQLEAIGLWEWAVFVLLHLKDDAKREYAVRSLIGRHCQLSTSADYLQKEQFLREKLLVPSEWIHEAKAVCAFYLDEPEKEAVHLLKSRKWNRCHQAVLGRFTSQAIIQEEFHRLYSILSELEPEERCSTVKDWENGGQVLLKFLEVTQKVKRLTEGSLEPTKYHFEEIHMQVSSLCCRLENLPSETAEDRLCQYELAKQCANYLKIANLELSELCIAEDTLLPSKVIVPYINKLPLPEDCAITELRDVTARYIVENQ